ncbi:MAG: PF20097 family protein [Planctomycetota bacterium]
MLKLEDRARCPGCNAYMASGYLSVSQGLRFIRNHDHRNTPMAEHLPGTHAVLRSNRLPAWKCAACEAVLFRYGRKLQRELERSGAFDREHREAAALASLQTPENPDGESDPDALDTDPANPSGPRKPSDT